MAAARVALGWLAAAMVLAAPDAMAQKATDPGQIEKRIQAPAAPSRPVKKIEAPTLKAPPPVDARAKKFVLVGVEITGATVFSPTELASHYESFLGREISLAEVETILKAITEKYRGGGYILSRAVAPPQSVEFSVLRIDVIEGYVERVDFKGANLGRPGLFRALADNITGARPLSLGVLERYLLLMADAPGVSVVPALKPLDEKQGAFLLEITRDLDSVDGFVNLDDRGTTPVGVHQAFVGINLNSALGLMGRTRLAVFTIPATPEELLFFELSQEHILNAEGTKLSLSASRSLVDTREVRLDTKENSFGTRFVLSISHPIIRRRDSSLTVGLKLDSLDSDKNSASDVFDERLRVFRLNGQYNFVDRFDSTNFLSAELSQGANILHASDRDATLISCTNGRTVFTKLVLDMTRVQKLTKDRALQISVNGQKSNHTLLSSEEFSVGGQRFGRAYDPSSISSSQGAAGSLELQFSSPWTPKPLESLQFYAFYDVGAVWGSGITRNSLASSGGGLRVTLPFNIGANLEVAQPLTRAITAGEADSDAP